MKKKIYFAVLSVLLVFSVVGCGKKDDKKEEAVTVQSDLMEFVNEELPGIASYRDGAISSYNAYFSTAEVDTSAFLSDLQSTMIPNMETYIAELTAIDVATDEVTALKSLYLQSAEKQCEAMEMVALAISEQDPSYLDLADTLIAEAQSLLTQYESELKILAIDNDVEIVGSFE